ncbi:MAG: CmpA/NrtA family ABC transporter substrate-binding protein [Pseudomonadota bacterium]
MSTNKQTLTLGFLPLLDASPLLLAQELGLFAAEGLKVNLSREASWANIRDKLYVGSLQGAQLLAPMAISVSLGLNKVKAPLVTGMVLSRNGNAITVSNSLIEQLRVLNPEALASPHISVLTLRKLINERTQQGTAALTLATVYPYSCHNYLLRYWLAAGGIHPDHDINMVVIPPEQMVAQLASGRIDGFCVGEPWNQVAVAQGHGKILLNTWDIWHNAPEKVLAVHGDWAAANEDTHLALITATLRACRWLEEPANRDEALAILTQPQYLGFTPETLASGFKTGRHQFFRDSANYPWPAHGTWLLSQMMRWGHVPSTNADHSFINSIFLSSLFEQACRNVGIPCATEQLYQIGKHAASWELGEVTVGADRFIDGIRFNPDDTGAYLQQFAVSNLDS